MILIDYSNILIITLTVELAQMGEKQSPDLARHLFLNNIRNYRKKFKGKYGELVFAVDSKTYWRKQEFPYYKANRKKNRDDSNFDWDFIFYCMDLLKNELINFFPYKVIEVENAESDDIIGVLVKHHKEPNLIISSDNDFIQLQRFENVQQYSTTEKDFIKPIISAEADLLEKIIRGDRGDSIPSAISPDDTFVTGQRQKPITKKRLEAFLKEIPKEYESYWNRNRKLIDLSQTPIEIENEIIQKYENYEVNGCDLLYSYFVKNKLAKLLEYIAEFK
jgi:hypothetical protein